MTHSRRVAAFPALAALALWLTSASAAPPEWREPDAPVRLRAAPAGLFSHLLRVDIPRPVAATALGVSAFGAGGRPLQASLIVFGGQAVGAEVYVPQGKVPGRNESPFEASALGVELYLFPEDRNPRPLGDDMRLPVELARDIQTLTTRPFTAAEMTRLTGRIGERKIAFAMHVATFGEAPDRDHWRSPPEKRSAVLRWSGELPVPEPRTVSLGGTHDHVAWFIYVDGEPVADWRVGLPRPGGGRMTPPLTLSRGFHRIDFLAVQNQGEPLPAMVWGDPGTPGQAIAAADLVSARRPEAVAVDFGPSGASVGIALEDVTRLLVPSFPGDLLSYRGLRMASLGGDGEADIEPFGGTVPMSRFPEIPVRVPGGEGVLADLTFPAYPAWYRAETPTCDVRLDGVAPVLAAADPLVMTARVGISDPPAGGYADRLRLRWRQLAPDDSQVAEGDAPLTGSESDIDLRVARHAAAARLILTCVLDGYDISAPTEIRFATPRDDLSDLRVRGRSLFLGGRRTVLVCDPIRPLQLPRLRHRPSKGPITLVDDMLATAAAPGADLLPEVWFRDEADMDVVRLSAAAGMAAGTSVEMLKFGVLPRLYAGEPGVVVWMVGSGDLRAGLPAEGLCSRLLFLAQATAARGSIPVLVALPRLPGVSPEDARRAALLTKEVAFKCGIPVADAFSSEKLGLFGPGGFPAYFAPGKAGGVAPSTPVNAGREAVFALLRDVLREDVRN